MSKVPNEKRSSPRKKGVADLSKHLITASTRSPVRCIAVDVSRTGIGLVSFDDLVIGSEVILVLQERGVVLRVKWCKPDTLRNNVFHAGVETNDPAIDLVHLLEKEGLINQSEPEPLTNASPAPDDTDLPVEFSVLRDHLATSRMPDPDLLRRGKFTKLADSHDCYPIKFQGKSFCILLPKGLKPIEASKFDDVTAAAQKVFVIKTERGGIKVVWPAGAKSGKLPT